MLTEFQKKMKIRSRIMAAIIMISFCVMSLPITVMAEPQSWTKTQQNTTIAGMSSGTDEFKNPFDDDVIQENDNNWILKLLGKVLAISGTGVEYGLSKMGMSVDSVILGRMSSSSTSIGDVKNPFHFELAEGNIYGYTSAVAYSVLRQLVSIFMAIVFMIELAKCGLSLNGQDKARLKDYTVHFIFVFLLLYLMPNIVDLFIYVKNWALLKIATTLKNEAGAFSITTTMYSIFQHDPGVITGFMYLASVVLMMYLMALYIGNALGCTVLFAFFPLVGIMSVKERSLLSSWTKQIIGTLFIPLLDGVLLFVPAMFFKYTSNYLGNLGWDADGIWRRMAISIISLLLCFFIIPARNVVINALGIGSAGFGGANAGLLATAAAAKAAKDFATERKKSKEKKEAAADEREKAHKKADEEDHKADLEEQAGKLNGTIDGSGKGSMNTNTSMSQFDGDENNKSEADKTSENPISDEAAENIKPQNPINGEEGAESVPTGDGNPERLKVPDDKDYDNINEDTIHESTPKSADVDADNIIPQNAPGARESNLNDIDQSNRDIANETSNIRQLRSENANSKAHIEELARENNKIDADAGGKRPSDEMLAQKAANNLKISEEKTRIANNDSLIQDATQRLENAKERRDNAISNERAFASEDKAMGGTGRTFRSVGEFKAQQGKSKALADLATHKDFDNPMFEGHLTSSQKAQFRRERAAEMRADANKEYRQKINRARAEEVGALAGGVAGGLLTSMVDPSVGASIGSTLGSTAPVTINNMRDTINNIDYSKADVARKKAVVAQAASSAVSKASNSSIAPVAAVGKTVQHVSNTAAYMSNNAALGVASAAQGVASNKVVSSLPGVNMASRKIADAADKRAKEVVSRNYDPSQYYKSKAQEYDRRGTRKRMEQEGYEQKFIDTSGISSNIKAPMYTKDVILSDAGKNKNWEDFRNTLPSEMLGDSAFEIYGSAGGRYQHVQELARNGDIDGARREMESLYTDYMNSNPEQK